MVTTKELAQTVRNTNPSLSAAVQHVRTKLVRARLLGKEKAVERYRKVLDYLVTHTNELR